MKLLFPNGEHGPVELKDGTTRIGSGAGVDVTLVAPGIAPQHCTIEKQGAGGIVRLAAPGNVVVVNGKQVAGEAPIKAGDLLLIAKVGARVVSLVGAAAAAPARKPEPAPSEDDGKTRVRMALPRFVLRGVSGSTFGKTFPLFGTMTVWLESSTRRREIPERVSTSQWFGAMPGAAISTSLVAAAPMRKPTTDARASAWRCRASCCAASPAARSARRFRCTER